MIGERAPQIADLLGEPVAGQVASAADLAELLARTPGDIVLVDAELDCSGLYPIEDVCAPQGTRVLVGVGGTAQVRIASCVVVGAGTSQAPLDSSNGTAAGCLQVAEADRPALDHALARIPDGPPGALWEQVQSLLVMQAVEVKPVYAAPFRIGRAVGRDSDPVRLQARRCARGGDGWLSERTVRPLSRQITPWAVKAGLAPTTVTVASLIVGASAVATAVLGTRWGYLATAVLMIVSLVLDCIDGEVARWTHRYSRGGAWLDAVGDRVKEYAVWFAVAWAVGQQDFWLLILSCLILFTSKHFLDYGWSLRFPPWRPRAIPMSAEPDPWQAAGVVPPSVRPPSWRRVLGMPIAERWLLVAVLLPLTGPWVTFSVLVVLGALSLAYTVLTRIRWSHAPIDPVMRPQLVAITDPGFRARAAGRMQWGPAALLGLLVMVVAAAGAPWVVLAGYAIALGLYEVAYGSGPRGRLGWMAPSVARTSEMAILLAASWFAPQPAGAAVFALLAASAWRHYDVIYRIRNQHVLPDRRGTVLLLGTAGRVLVAIVLLLVFGSGAWLWFALYLAVVAVLDSLRSWFRR